jgi:hypothetical protein
LQEGYPIALFVWFVLIEHSILETLSYVTIHSSNKSFDTFAMLKDLMKECPEQVGKFLTRDEAIAVKQKLLKCNAAFSTVYEADICFHS